MTAMTRDEIQRGLAENRQAPNGSARNAHAEALAAAAEVSGDRALFRETLDNLINSYLYSSESSKMLVPFARLLQEYDKDPAAFSQWDTHSLFWQFKWIATAIGDSPDVPVESANGWLDEMERRYRIAGYSERPVRESELWLADAIGDDDRAERAFTRWLAAERDDMSDCKACELNGQGQYAVLRGDDVKALDLWQPVLTGELTCAEEPHRVLATSLLPLLRLGRADEARSNHLRGYRLVRGNESLLPSVGKHIEFCALTGNESRGLEILADHAAHVGPLVNVDDQLAFHGGILVLLRRLRELGHGDSPAVPYEGVPRTVSELHGLLFEGVLAIARRFDARNGTTRVSDRFRSRIEREPLVGVLPLGVRSAALPQARPVPAAPAPAPTMMAGDLTELVERARDARHTGHPSAAALWEEIAVRVSARPESEVDPLLAADVADHRALVAARAGAPDAARLLVDVRDGYRALGQVNRAALVELRLATVAARRGAAPAEIRDLLAVGLRAAEALDPADPARVRRIAAAELAALRLEPYLRSVEGAHAHEDGHDHVGHGHEDHGHEDHGHEAVADALDSFVASYEQVVPDLAADAEEVRGRLALSQGDTDEALLLLARSATRSVEAGRPWQAVDPLVLRAGVLMSLGRPQEAEEAARSGLEHAAEVTDPEEQGVVRLTLADILVRRREAAVEAAEHALTAAHWFDQAGLSADGGAQARLMLARAYAGQGKTADAAEVLQSALADLLEHGEGQAVSAREFLGGLLRELREWRSAAEQYLLAAELVKDWEDPRPQASLAQSAADCLSDAGLVEEAVAAYERALELHRRTGEAVIAEVRILRSLAWLGLRPGASVTAVAAARSRMDEAAAVLETALAAEPDVRTVTGLRAELAQTWHQLAQVLDRLVTEQESGDSGERTTLGESEIEALRLEEILLWERAAALYADLGSEHLQDRFQCLNNAAWTDQELGRPEAGAARIAALIEEVEALPEESVPEWLLPQARQVHTSLSS
ncbi:tetratricopeptide repeat protein [Streptomyces sp. RerS4]|uniref:tetratricopeptide repeat protein n=1 Tax=Streptomyces sp. RerS4 TaxID=2942449 RepID=UPI00201C6DC5|nr:tetratricopeptide repeat protein [Streptomyces sp. RerS4]UQX02053.1 tetratricopeptide repeat protein [Streptomyces sp. RerS4]